MLGTDGISGHIAVWPCLVVAWLPEQFAGTCLNGSEICQVYYGQRRRRLLNELAKIVVVPISHRHTLDIACSEYARLVESL